MTRGVNVVYGGEGDPPTPSDLIPRSRRPRRGRVARRGRSGGEKMSAWDHITDTVRGLGLLPVMRGFDLLLIEPRTLYSTEGVRRMVYGRNLSDLSFKRRMGGVKTPTIEVRSYDPERGRTLWARYPTAPAYTVTQAARPAVAATGSQPAQPARAARRVTVAAERSSGIVGVDPAPRPTRSNRVPPSGAVPDEGVRVILVSGITDPDTLVRVAQNAFEQLGRQEISGQLKTNDAWSYDAEPDEADLLQIDAGDSVEVLVAQYDPRNDDLGTGITASRLAAMERSRRRDYLVSLGWSREVAARFARLQDSAGTQTVFRVERARIDFDDSGIAVSIDFMNYVTIREDAP